jgi:demethylmenaquinone methyltransferase/2-methoxy-6-polyprenyl-1,4-benzoquinol methylase
MFDNIAERYDLLNRIISLGIDQSWRRKTVDALRLKEGDRALDLATGTGDLALLIARRAPGTRVTGVDPSRGMLGVGLVKIAQADMKERIELLSGDAQHLQFEDDTFDGTTIAFGIRKVPDRERGLSEMARVTKPGGRIAILELSEPEGGLMAPFARFHVHTLVPWLGSLLSGQKEYQYLQKSIAAFPPPQEFAETMEQCGLTVLEVVPLTFGVAHLYIATPRAIVAD